MHQLVRLTALGLTAGGPLAVQGRQPVRIAVPQGASLSHLPLQLAGALGFLDAEGLDVQWVPVASDLAAIQALGSGRVQAAALDFTQVLQHHGTQGRGADLCAVVLQARSPQRVFGVQPKAAPGMARGPLDLRGRRIGTSADLPSQLLTSRLIQLAGLNGLELSVTTLLDPVEVMERYRHGAIDAFCLDHVLVAGLEQRGEVKVVADTRTVRGTTEVHGGPVPGTVVCVTRQAVRAQAPMCQALAHGVVHALMWLRTAGPSDLSRVMPEAMQGPDRAHYLAAFEKARDGLSTDGLMPEGAASSALLAMLRLDASLTRLRPQLQDAYTNDYALKAKQRFRA